MKSIDEFRGAKNGYSRSITLRNAIVPVVSNFQTISTSIKI